MVAAPVGSIVDTTLNGQDAHLLAAVKHGDLIQRGRTVVVLHFSRLPARQRRPGFLRVASRMLEPLAHNYSGQIYQLNNADVVLVLSNPAHNDLELSLFRMRSLFSAGGDAFTDAGEGHDDFRSIFDLSRRDNMDHFLIYISTLSEENNAARDPVAPVRVFDPSALAQAMERLLSLDFPALIRRQCGIRFDATGSGRVQYQEFFVPTQDLAQALELPSDPTSEPRLFQYLTRGLDIPLIKSLVETRLRHRPACYHLNLNVATILSVGFNRFLRSVQPDSAVGVELQLADIFAEIESFPAARRKLRDTGCQLVIDNVTEPSVQLMDLKSLEADYYKIHWSPDMSLPARDASVREALAAIPPHQIILSRCDSESAIQWGLLHGITSFQGRLIDALLAVYALQSCNGNINCTVQQCIARRSSIGGPLRQECGSLDMLDQDPVLLLPAKRKGTD